MKDRAPGTFFVVGQVVGLLPPAARQFLTRPGRYRILRPLPIEIGAEPRYDVESVTDGHRRAVEAACLEALSPLPASASEPAAAAVSGRQPRTIQPKPRARSSAAAKVGKKAASKALPRLAAASARMAKAVKLAKPKKSKLKCRSGSRVSGQRRRSK